MTTFTTLLQNWLRRLKKRRTPPRHPDTNSPTKPQANMAKTIEKPDSVIAQSNYFSRDLSWLKFNERVLDQARNPDRSLMDRLKFLAITASNLDEFFSIRIGSLYNYLDYGRKRVDYSGLREGPFKKTVYQTVQQFNDEQQRLFADELRPLFTPNELGIITFADLTPDEQARIKIYFDRTIYPSLTPMLYDYTHTFPVLLAKVLIFGVVTYTPPGDFRDLTPDDDTDNHRLSFVQIPSNLPRFMVIDRPDDVRTLFLPIEEIVRHNLRKLYRNVEIQSATLFRLIRNGDFTLDENEDAEAGFIDEVQQKIKSRRLGRVVRVELEQYEGESCNWMIELLKKRWEIDQQNLFIARSLLDFTGLWQLVKHPDFREQMTPPHEPVPPLSVAASGRTTMTDIFDAMKERDILLHHPYNNFEPVLQLLEQAADDPKVLSIKLTIYRLAKNSRVTEALLKAAENGKYVAVLFEVKARFDEENNIREAQRLQQAGCFVIYGISRFKTHTKLLLVVRNEGDRVVQYAHLSSGNYNEDTSKLYTDIALLTTDEVYTHDIAEFFNVITGHSLPDNYQYLITAPRNMRPKLLALIGAEADNARRGLPSGICIKINSLEDKAVIDALYEASQAGVPIRLIVRGICCVRPGRAGLSENITVRSIVGDFLEHTRLYYFHNQGEPKVYGGSADAMVRSLDRRIESLFLLADRRVRQQAIHILQYNLLDNVNAYTLNEDGTYTKVAATDDAPPINVHQYFFDVTEAETETARLFDSELHPPVAPEAAQALENVENAIADL
jgi:polyphosphate kinase